MNSYNIFDEKEYSTILYHSVAESEEQVRELADQAGYDLSGLTIEFERANVKDQLGRPYNPTIEDVLMH